ncbi:MAG: FHA domain-containing protein [Desulfovibrio sp.]|nr:MAG: FHA domain-containing protein [Desulfovibrio sp.]
MRQTGSSLAVAFADICRSTRLYEQFGDERALDIISKALSLLTEETTSRQGKVIKTMGDEIMASFPDARLAVEAARAMHKAVKNDEELCGLNLSLRIGLHYGGVIYENQDLFGDAVIIAARAVQLAGMDQIITTKETIQQLPEDLFMFTRSLGCITVKGKDRCLDFFEIFWQEDRAELTTVQYHDFPRDDSMHHLLTLAFEDQSIELGEQRPQFQVGRGENNDLVVANQYVSNRHATIEYRNGRFILVDHSTNGTYLRIEERESTFVHRDEAHLLGAGIISLGRSVSRDHPGTIKYSVG